MNELIGRRTLRRRLILFVFLSVVYHSNLRPIAAGDSLPASLIPLSILLDGSVALDRFAPYLRKATGITFLSALTTTLPVCKTSGT